MCKSPEVGRSRAVSRAWGGSLVATAEGCLWGCAARGRPEETWPGVGEGSAVLLPRAGRSLEGGQQGSDSRSHACSNESLAPAAAKKRSRESSKGAVRSPSPGGREGKRGRPGRRCWRLRWKERGDLPRAWGPLSGAFIKHVPQPRGKQLGNIFQKFSKQAHPLTQKFPFCKCVLIEI